MTSHCSCRLGRSPGRRCANWSQNGRRRCLAAGLAEGGCVALRLPPSLAYVANLLAVWRIGAQAVLLDHRLTQYEVDQAVQRLGVQLVVAVDRTTQQPAECLRRRHRDRSSPARGSRLGRRMPCCSSVPGPPDRPRSSGVPPPTWSPRSTGTPRSTACRCRGERIILLPSMVHVLGLVGGLLYGLHAGVELVPPQRLTGDSILERGGVRARRRPPCSACRSTSDCSPRSPTRRSCRSSSG